MAHAVLPQEPFDKVNATNHSPHTVPQPEARAARIKADGIHARLREATADQHHHLDRGLHDVLTHTLSMDRDGDLLAASAASRQSLVDNGCGRGDGVGLMVRRDGVQPFVPWRASGGAERRRMRPGDALAAVTSR